MSSLRTGEEAKRPVRQQHPDRDRGGGKDKGSGGLTHLGPGLPSDLVPRSRWEAGSFRLDSKLPAGRHPKEALTRISESHGPGWNS